MGQKAPRQGTRTQMERSLCCSSYHPNCLEGRRYRALGALQSRTPSYFSRTRRREKTMGSVSTPVQPFKIEDPAPAAGPTRLIWTVIWMTVLLCPVTASVNPHQPVKITWTLWNGLTREVLNLTTGIHPPNTWWPDVYFNLKDLIKTTWTAAQTRNFGFWACPGHLKRHNWETCGGLQHYFCWSWSCVTSNDGRWKWEVGNRD